MRRLWPALALLLVLLAGCSSPGRPSLVHRPHIRVAHTHLHSITVLGHRFVLRSAGAPIVGEVLVTTPGTWGGNPTRFTYLWEDCDSLGNGCAPINGASGSSYLIVSGDLGHTLRVISTAYNNQGSAGSVSAATGVVSNGPSAPVNTAAPAASGTAILANTLSVTNGTWTNTPTSYTYQWQDCHDYQAEGAGITCSNATGTGNSCTNAGTGCNYTLAASDVAYNMRVQVTASNGAGSTAAVSVGSGAPSFNQNGTSPMVLGSTSPDWSSSFVGAWGSSGHGGCTNAGPLASDGFHSEQGNPANSTWSTLGYTFTNRYFTFTDGSSLATSPGSSPSVPTGGPALAGHAWDDLVDASSTDGTYFGQRGQQSFCPTQNSDYGNQSTTNDARSNQGQTEWYRFGFMLGSDYTPDGDSLWNYLFDFHQQPDSPCCLPVSLLVASSNRDGSSNVAYNTAPYGRLDLEVQGGGSAGSAATSNGVNITGGTNSHFDYVVGPNIVKNHWYDVLLKIHWSYDTTGETEWWLDGHLRGDLTGAQGPNNYYIAGGYENPYMQLTQYRAGCEIGDGSGNGVTLGASPPGTESCSTGAANFSVSEVFYDNLLMGSSEASVGGGP